MNKAFRYAGFLIIALIMLSMGCSKSTSSDYDEDRINTIMYNIRTAFNDHEIDNLMNYIHIDYLHKGKIRWQIREDWLDRMAKYQLIDFQNIDIEVNDENAIVTFTMKLQNQSETVYSNEPNRNGDLSYFIYDNNDWHVFGNQLPE